MPLVHRLQVKLHQDFDTSTSSATRQKLTYVKKSLVQSQAVSTVESQEVQVAEPQSEELEKILTKRKSHLN